MRWLLRVDALYWYAIISATPEAAQHPKQMTIATAFTAKVATLDSASLRSLYKQLFNQPLVPFQCLDIVLNRMMDLDGVEAVDAFIDTVA